jgi:hypothetical protein
MLTALSGEFSDGRQYFPAVPEQDADVLEVLIGKMGKDRDVDAVLRKCAGGLGQAEPREPIGYFLHRRPDFGLVDPLFYPIDRAARNRLERSAAGVTGGSPKSHRRKPAPSTPRLFCKSDRLDHC